MLRATDRPELVGLRGVGTFRAGQRTMSWRASCLNLSTRIAAGSPAPNRLAMRDHVGRLAIFRRRVDTADPVGGIGGDPSDGAAKAALDGVRPFVEAPGPSRGLPGDRCRAVDDRHQWQPSSTLRSSLGGHGCPGSGAIAPDERRNDHVHRLPATGRTAAKGPQSAWTDVHHPAQTVDREGTTLFVPSPRNCVSTAGQWTNLNIRAFPREEPGAFSRQSSPR